MYNTVMYKYPLNYSGETEIECQYELWPRHIDLQDGKLLLWAEVDMTIPANNVKTKLISLNTGEPYEGELSPQYVGTIQTPFGIVKHVFALFDYGFAPTPEDEAPMMQAHSP